MVVIIVVNCGVGEVMWDVGDVVLEVGCFGEFLYVFFECDVDDWCGFEVVGEVEILGVLEVGEIYVVVE